MPEKTLLEEGDVLITTARLVHQGNTYKMGTVISFKPSTSRYYRGPAILIGFSLVGWYFYISAIVRGQMSADWYNIIIIPLVLLSAILIGVHIMYKANRSLTIRTSGGETETITSSNPKFIQRVREAIEECMTG